jgi:hypothetical protein
MLSGTSGRMCWMRYHIGIDAAPLLQVRDANCAVVWSSAEIAGPASAPAPAAEASGGPSSQDAATPAPAPAADTAGQGAAGPSQAAVVAAPAPAANIAGQEPAESPSHDGSFPGSIATPRPPLVLGASLVTIGGSKQAPAPRLKNPPPARPPSPARQPLPPTRAGRRGTRGLPPVPPTRRVDRQPIKSSLTSSGRQPPPWSKVPLRPSIAPLPSSPPPSVPLLLDAVAGQALCTAGYPAVGEGVVCGGLALCGVDATCRCCQASLQCTRANEYVRICE